MKRIAVIDCTLSKLETGANSLLLRETAAVEVRLSIALILALISRMLNGFVT